MSEQNKQITRQLLADVFEHGRLEALDELVSITWFLGKAPTGKEYAAQQIHIWRIEDGKVIEHWACRDDLGQALQLGLIGA